MDSNHVHPIRSAAFRDWIIAQFYALHESAPAPGALRAALRTLEARARHGEWPAQKFDRRLGFQGDSFIPSKILLDLTNSSGDLVEITSRGWRLTGNLHHFFRESDSVLALPRPIRPESSAANPLNTLTTLFSLQENDHARLLTWLISALRPTGPYPILVIRGPASSGKSFLTRALRSLIDPSAAPLRRLPGRDREVMRLAFQNWILAFDHVHQVSPRISEALCALSSGDAFEIPQPDLRDPVTMQLARPVILIAPIDETQPAWTPSRSLSNRTLSIRLAPLAFKRPESILSAEFEAAHAAQLAALCDAVASALHNIREVDLNVPRFSDCANWTAAAAPSLGLSEQTIASSIADPAGIWIGADPLRDTLHSFLEPHPVWRGDATTLLSQLRASAPFAILPSTPKMLSESLAGIPGIRFERTKDSTGARILTISRVTEASERTVLTAS